MPKPMHYPTHDSDSPDANPKAELPDRLSWTERAHRMVEYYPDALAFIARASEHFPAHAGHARLLLRLWVEADALDSLILPMLSEMNNELMAGEGELDTTRGVSTQPSALGAFDDASAEEVVYECSWSLRRVDGSGVSVVLSVNDDGIFYAQARGSASAHEHRVGYPVTRTALEDALVAVYVSEATSI